MTRSREYEPAHGPLELPDASTEEQRRLARDREPPFAERAVTSIRRCGSRTTSVSTS